MSARGEGRPREAWERLVTVTVTVAACTSVVACLPESVNMNNNGSDRRASSIAVLLALPTSAGVGATAGVGVTVNWHTMPGSTAKPVGASPFTCLRLQKVASRTDRFAVLPCLPYSWMQFGDFDVLCPIPSIHRIQPSLHLLRRPGGICTLCTVPLHAGRRRPHIRV